jgi:thiol-disulfide isomerase/thioredoxin
MLLHAAILALASLVPPQAPAAQKVSPEDAAWAAAHALKRKADYERAAQAVATFAQTFPGTPHAVEAQVEDGVCWFSLGRSRQKLQRNDSASLAAFAQARARFDAVLDQHAGDPLAPRAQYMRGTVALFSGDLLLADTEYGRAIERYGHDVKYGPKSLERRAAVRRHLLQAAGARADLQRYVKEFPKGEDVESVKRYLEYLSQFEKPAPELAAEAWVQGDAVTLAGLKGDPVILYFFATWCENCEKARPFLLDLHQRYEAMGVRMIGVVDHSQGQTLESVRAFLVEKGIRFPVMMDSGRTTAAYKGQKIPDIVLLDRLGRVRWHDNPANLQDATVELLLTEDPAAGPTK